MFMLCKEIRKLTFRALALRRSEWIRSDEGLALETSASESLYGTLTVVVGR